MPCLGDGYSGAVRLARAAALTVLSCLCTGLCLCSAALAQDDDADSAAPSAAPRLRVELWGGDTFSGKAEWLHDPYFAAALEYEWMLFGPVSMGLRALPALAYFDSSPVVGTALGVTNRLYLDRSGTGFYAGPAIAVVGHYGRFPGNSAYVNFLSSFELGYQLPESPLRMSVKLEHMSNANTAEQNRGWNGLSLMVGWEFPLPRRAPAHDAVAHPH